jgi:hypothetical protein
VQGRPNGRMAAGHDDDDDDDAILCTFFTGTFLLVPILPVPFY